MASGAPVPRQERMGSVEARLWGAVGSGAWTVDDAGWRADDAGLDLLIGLDEAGRGPLAGPVSVAAVALRPDRFTAAGRPAWFDTIDDSKKLTERRRESLYASVIADAAAFAIVHVHADHVDAVNILQATLHGMAVAVELLLGLDGTSWPGRPAVEVVRHAAGLPVAWYGDRIAAGGVPVGADALACPMTAPMARLLVDGNASVSVVGSVARGLPQESIVKGDALSVHIAAASILAKVSRDRVMTLADAQWPGYGLAGHKGYPTRSHKAALVELGPCPIHRRTFAGVVLDRT